MAVTPISLKREFWGPCAWKILHSLAEKSGLDVDPITHQQEREAWVTLLTNLRDSMPCDLCRKHYGEYLTKSNPKGLLDLKGSEFQNSLRIWLFTLHEAVNTRNQKDSDVKSVEDCKVRYEGLQSIDTEIKTLIHIFDYAVIRGKALPLNVRNTKTAIQRLRGIYRI